jgi:hypothetical protein
MSAAKTCAGCEGRPDCQRLIPKPARGPWPERCEDCKRARDAERKRCAKKGHTFEHGPCRRCGTYVLKAREQRLPRDAHRYSAPRASTARGLNLDDDVDRTASQRERDGEYVPEADLWPGMGSRLAASAPDLRIEAMRAAVRKGLHVELTRDQAGRVVVRISGRSGNVLLEAVRIENLRALRALGADQEILEAEEAWWQRQELEQAA